MPGATIDQEHKVLDLSQSWLQDFQRCPERARLSLLYPVFEHSSETAIGTALHLFMEHRLLGLDTLESIVRAEAWLESVVAPPTEDRDYTYRSTMGKDTMFRHLIACAKGFDRHVVPQVPPGGMVETTLRAVLVQDGDWTVWLNGRPDYLDPQDRLWDWKTAGSAYNVQETSRWAIQPTAYTFLASQHEGAHITDFTYAVGVKPQGIIQFIDVERHPDDWQWLARVAQGALGLARNMLHEEWPVIHGHWLCSEKWCPHWDGCRGKYITAEQETGP